MAKSNWIINTKTSKRIFPELPKAVEKILKNRGIKDEIQLRRFLHPDFDRDSHDPFLLSGMKKAVKRCLQAINNKENICVYADYDADGITSSVILIKFFEKIGINVASYIPDRNKEGYGLNESALDKISKDKTKLLITVDCGISNENEISYAKQLGIDVIVIDHHHVPPKIPDALAIVDPKQKKDKYPEKNLSGVGVTFKFLQAISSKIDDYDPQQLKWLLDLVAIGTIADCVPLVGENRMLSRFGLLVLSKTNNTGLKQLIHVGRIPINQGQMPSAETISFQVAPRVNAAGRMDHANIAQSLLLCKKTQESKARLIALEIEEKNNHRQKVTRHIVDKLNEKISSKKTTGIVIETSKNWELGVIGLAAGKITDQHQMPSILLKDFGQYYKGSGRSIPGFNMIDALEDNRELLEKYGGHPQAVGLEIKKVNFKKFVRAMNIVVEKISKDKFVKEFNIDCNLTIEEINDELYDLIQKLEPFGEGNRKPIFQTNKLVVESLRLVGNGEKHLKMICASSTDENFKIDVIGFGLAKNYSDLKIGNKINIIYHLDKNTWNGESNYQAQLKDLEIIHKTSIDQGS